MGSNLGAIAAMLTDSLKLAQPPIAVCLMHDVPAGIKHWAGRVPAGCRFWQEPAGEVFATSPRDHHLCAIGTLTHNLEVTSGHEAVINHLKSSSMRSAARKSKLTGIRQFWSPWQRSRREPEPPV